MTFLYFLIIFLLAHTGDFLNNLFLSKLSIDFLLIFPLAIILMQRNWISCVFFVFFGFVADSYSTGFFGIHGFAFFLTGTLIIWMAKELLTDSMPILFLSALLANLLVHVITALLLYMTEGQNFIQGNFARIILINILPTSGAFIPVYAFCRMIRNWMKLA